MGKGKDVVAVCSPCGVVHEPHVQAEWYCKNLALVFDRQHVPAIMLFIAHEYCAVNIAITTSIISHSVRNC